MEHPSDQQAHVDDVHDERLWPSAGVWFLVLLMAAAGFVVALPVGLGAGVAVAAVTAAALSVAAVRSAATVAVRDGVLWAGRAHVPTSLVGQPVAARGPQARHERGPGLDARAYLLIRAWVDPVVRVPLEDPSDPTPYWLVSSRRPEQLVAALDRARAGD